MAPGQRLAQAEQAFCAELYARYRRLVYKIAYLLLGDAAAAEDALQTVFWRVARQPGAYDPERGSPQAWLRRVTVNHCLNVRRSWRQAPLELADPARQADPGERPESRTLSRDRARAIWAALAELSPSLRAALVLRFYEELSYAEIAEALAVPLGTVKWRIHEGLRRLRQSLGEEGDWG